MSQEVLSKERQERKQVFQEIVNAFEQKYGWLGLQTSRQLLLSAASWNIDKYSDPPMRYRNHVMLAWDRGWLKSSMMRKMANILGDEFCSTIGKVTDAAMRGSVSAGQFTPPKPLRTPVVISTEFGQTDFSDELLNLFLALLEESETNVALNKIGQLGQATKSNIENKYNGQVKFSANNEFDLKCDFIFWGATYDPSKLQDDALRSRFEVVTPAKELDSSITRSIDQNRFNLSNTTIKDCRRMVKSEKEVETNFHPPRKFYEEYNLIPRESRDIQAHMACRNWWGLDVSPEIMKQYIQHLKQSRRVSTMNPRDRVFDMIFDNPMSLTELNNKLPYEKQEIFKILQDLPTDSYRGKDSMMWVIHSGENLNDSEDEKIEDKFGK